MQAIDLGNGVYSLRATGDLDLSLLGEFDTAVQTILCAPDLRRIVLNLEDAISVDSTMLGAILRVHRMTHGRDIPVCVVAPARIERIMIRLGMHRLVTVEASRH